MTVTVRTDLPKLCHARVGDLVMLPEPETGDLLPALFEVCAEGDGRPARPGMSQGLYDDLRHLFLRTASGLRVRMPSLSSRCCIVARGPETAAPPGAASRQDSRTPNNERRSKMSDTFDHEGDAWASLDDDRNDPPNIRCSVGSRKGYLTHWYNGGTRGRQRCRVDPDGWRDGLCTVWFADGTFLAGVDFRRDLEPITADERPSWIARPEDDFAPAGTAEVPVNRAGFPRLMQRETSPGRTEGPSPGLSPFMLELRSRLAGLGEVLGCHVSVEYGRPASATAEARLLVPPGRHIDMEDVGRRLAGLARVRSGEVNLQFAGGAVHCLRLEVAVPPSDAPASNKGFLQITGRASYAHLNTKKESNMKTKHQELLAALQTGMTTVECYFPESGATGKGYTYKVPKGWAERLLEGSRLVVETPAGMTVVTVREVHRSPRIEPGINYKWAVQVVDRTEHLELVAKEEAFLAEMEEVERAHRAGEMLKRAGEALGTNTAARRRFDKAVRDLRA